MTIIKKNISKVCIVLLVVSFIIYSLISKPPTELIKKNIHNSSTSKTGGKSIVQNSSNISSSENQFLIGDTVTTAGNMAYKINSVRVSKELKPFDKNNFDYWDSWHETVDSNGTLTCDKSYVIINISIKNNTDKEVEHTLNTSRLQAYDDSGNPFDNVELRFFDKGIDVKDPDYFNYKFKANEEAIFNFIFILDDSNLKYKNLTYIINEDGSYPYNKNTKYIKLDY